MFQFLMVFLIDKFLQRRKSNGINFKKYLTRKYFLSFYHEYLKKKTISFKRINKLEFKYFSSFFKQNSIYKIYTFTIIKKQYTIIMDFEKQLLQDEILLAKYEFIQKLGEGCFGKLYKVRNKQLKIITALKVQFVQKLNKRPMLQNQSNILSIISEKPYSLKFYCYGQWTYGVYVEIQLLYKDLSILLGQKKFNIQEISLLAIKLFVSLSTLHHCQVIHQDIKLQNIMTNQKGEFIFIDFGISKILKQSDQWTEHKRVKGFVGTPRYASIRAHCGLNQSKKDDLQSLMYNLAFLFYKKLPWLSLKLSGNKKIQQIKNLKLKTAVGIFQQMSRPFANAFQYIRHLQHQQQPNYSYLTSIFNKRSNTLINPPKRKSLLMDPRLTNKNLSKQKTSKQQQQSWSRTKRKQKKKFSYNEGIRYQNQNISQYLELPFMKSSILKPIDQKSEIQVSNNANNTMYTFNLQATNRSQASSNDGRSRVNSIMVYAGDKSTNRSNIEDFIEQGESHKDEDAKQNIFDELIIPNISKVKVSVQMKNPFCTKALNRSKKC